MQEELKFPEGFLWGAATSSHQVEGNNHNDWSKWEQSEARLTELRHKGLDPRDFISGRACDSYNRYEEDFDIARSLGQNAHRFSIEWSRIEPERGKFNPEAIEHYKQVIQAIRDRGMEPMVTLWHFSNPIWFAQEGGFLNNHSPQYFTNYVKHIMANFKGDVRLWATFNEAFTIYAAFTKLSAAWPSRGRGILKFAKMRKNMARAHILAYQEVKKMDRDLLVGIVENNVYVPDTKSFWQTKLRQLFKILRNFYFLRKNTSYYDFIGLNYYHMSRKPAFNKKSEIISKQEVTEQLNREIYPEGIYHVLKDLSSLKKPIYITENGIPDAQDLKRARFIKEHLHWVHRAIQDGVDVRGYFYWSLLDNFEWAHGFGPRFGLVEMNYATMERRIRSSAYEYKKICESNSLEL